MTRSTRNRLDKGYILLGDIAAVLCAFLLSGAIALSLGLIVYENTFTQWVQRSGFYRTLHFLQILPVLVILFWTRDHYTRKRPSADEWLDIIKVVGIAAMAELFLSFLLKWYFSRAWFILMWLIALPLLPITRHLVKLHLQKAGRWIDNTLIVGIGTNAKDTARMLTAEPLCGYHISAFMVPPDDWEQMAANQEKPESISIAGRDIPVLDSGDDPGKLIDEMQIRHTVVALDSADMWHVSKLIFDAGWSRSGLNIAPNIRGVPLIGMELLHFFSQELILLQLRDNLSRRMPQRIKRLFDIAGALGLMIVLSPFLVILALIIARNGSSPIYSQERVGMGGKLFRMHKFRTMVPGADAKLAELLESDPKIREEWDRYHKLENDPRVTPFGAFLRRYSMDEIPQLWNVLVGEMSLVGPRPVESFELEGHDAHYYLQLRPGLSCLWQISGRSDTDFETRVLMDAWYARNWTLWYDLFILMKTVGVVIRGDGSR